MNLTDAGALVALLDKDDPNHRACISASKGLPPGPLLTTWPCFTEAMYLLGKVGGYYYQATLWKLWHDRKLVLHDLSELETGRLSTLMRKYQDTPMDLADASLLVAAESHKLSHVFTIDGHFRLYRMTDGSVLAVVP